MPAPYVRLGRVVKAHGVQGEVSVATRDDIDPTSLVGLEVWLVPPLPSGPVAYRISGVRPGPKGVLVQLDDVTSPDAAREIAGRWMLARAADVPEAPADAGNVIGYSVNDATHGDLGIVDDIIETGANDVLVLEGGPFGQVLIPVIDDVVLSVDDASQTIDVRILPGLINGDES